MAKNKNENIVNRPALSPETREHNLIAMAMNLAEQQLLDGTASSQVVTHFLKQGSVEHRLEIQKLENENALLKAKVKSLEEQSSTAALVEEALNAFKEYTGEN